jgi:hypothetical protein
MMDEVLSPRVAHALSGAEILAINKMVFKLFFIFDTFNKLSPVVRFAIDNAAA